MQNSPIITKMQVIPVAGYDGMLMTLSGAHAPCFTRNLVVLTDNAYHTGVGEIHGGDYTCDCLNAVRPLVEGQPVARYREVLQKIHRIAKTCRRRRRRGHPDAGYLQAEVRGQERVGHRVRHARPDGPVPRRTDVYPSGRGTAAQRSGDAGLYVLCLRQEQGA